MPEDSHEAPELNDLDVDKLEKESGKEWEEMSDDEKLEKLENK